MAFWAAIGILGVAAQGAISFLRKPNWTSQNTGLDSNWKRIALYSTIIGVLFVLGSIPLVLANALYPFSLVLVGIVSFLVFQSFITDFTLRYVDRWIMRIANLIALALGVYLMISYGTETEIVIFTVFTVVAFAIGFLPGIGDSDGRAFQLMILALFPIYGVDGIKLALMGMILSIIGYYVAYSSYKKEWEFKKLFTKLSFPMVPLILTPVLIILLFGRWIPTF